MTGVISASTMPGGPMRAYVAGIREFFGADHRFPPKRPAAGRQSRRIVAASLGDLTKKREARKRAPQRAWRVHRPGQALPRKSLKNRIKALSVRVKGS